ncbi:MAG: hypothetical protein AAGA85_07755 [Bacteroidota bacterium]
MIRIFGIVICLLVSGMAMAQTINEKIESRKIALITQKLELTPEQAERFWPIYREWSTKRLEIAKEFRQARQNFDPKAATEEETRRMLDMGLKVREQRLNLERDYSDRMRKVISDRQLLNLRRAEEDFKQMLLQRMQERQERAQQIRERNNALQQRRRNN